MKTTKNYIGITLSVLIFTSVSLLSFLIQSCKSDIKETLPKTVDIEKENVIEIITENMDFIAPDTIPKGWTTWRYINKSAQPHFILIDDYNDSITVKEFKEELLPPFGEGITKLYEGKNDEAMAAFGKIPEWYSDTKWPGGVGLISPGKTAETILKLEPGFYIIECYVKMSNGMFHTNMGMYKGLIVSDEKSSMEEPTADIAIDISSKKGIVFNPPTKAGAYTFSVNFLDQKKYENFEGHDINLVKMDEKTDLTTIEAWMNWLNLKGLIDPVPEGFTFLGGVNDMPAGSKGYFRANLEPGNYALISEVPKTLSKNLLKTFVISE